MNNKKLNFEFILGLLILVMTFFAFLTIFSKISYFSYSSNTHSFASCALVTRSASASVSSFDTAFLNFFISSTIVNFSTGAGLASISAAGPHVGGPGRAAGPKALKDSKYGPKTIKIFWNFTSLKSLMLNKINAVPSF